MAHVVTANCTDCRFTDCVTTCPVQAFHGDAERLYIDPETCIDCNACLPACPVRAIKEEVDLEADERCWASINAERSQMHPVIAAKQAPLPTAEARRKALGLS